MLSKSKYSRDVHLQRHLHNRAKSLRATQTRAEKILWNHLRAGRLSGYKFRRQWPIDRYIADFCCTKKKIIIEVDGNSHTFRIEYDTERDNRLHQLGYTILRFDNNMIEQSIDKVLITIKSSLS